MTCEHKSTSVIRIFGGAIASSFISTGLPLLFSLRLSSLGEAAAASTEENDARLIVERAVHGLPRRRLNGNVGMCLGIKRQKRMGIYLGRRWFRSRFRDVFSGCWQWSRGVLLRRLWVAAGQVDFDVEGAGRRLLLLSVGVVLGRHAKGPLSASLRCRGAGVVGAGFS